MDNNSIVALVFLVLGCLFVGSLLKGIWNLINSVDRTNFGATYILKLFAIPIITFIALMIFIIFIMP